MVTKSNEYVSEGPNKDQMKYLCGDFKSKHYNRILHKFDSPFASTAASPAETSAQPVAIVVWSGGQMR